MKLLKNREIKITLLFEVLISAVCITVGFLFNKWAGVTAIITSVLLVFAHFTSNYFRYKRISELSNNINKLLHGDDSITFENYSVVVTHIVNYREVEENFAFKLSSRNVFAESFDLAES